MRQIPHHYRPKLRGLGGCRPRLHHPCLKYPRRPSRCHRMMDRPSLECLRMHPADHGSLVWLAGWQVALAKAPDHLGSMKASLWEALVFRKIGH